MKPIILFFLGIACLVLIGIGLYQYQNQGQSNPQYSLFPNNGLPRISDNSIRLPGNSAGWFEVGSGNYVLTASGTVNLGKVISSTRDEGVVNVSPAGWSKVENKSVLVEGLPFGALLVRIGNQKPFVLGEYRRIISNGLLVFVAINDSDYADNTGEFVIKKTIPSNPKDLRDIYGIVRGTVFNKNTNVVFGDGFFQETGFTSFDGLIMDEVGKLPPNLTLPDGRPLTEKEAWIIEHRKVN